MPWTWRLGEVQAAQKKRDCAIKGNINRESERIYHLPGSSMYANIRMDRPEKRWFCSEAEAEAAGWRAAKDRRP